RGPREAWRAVAPRSAAERQAWERRLAAVDPAVRAEFQRRMRGDLPPALAPALRAYIDGVVSDPPALATRNASQNALDVINAAVPETVGGAAALTRSRTTPSRD